MATQRIGFIVEGTLDKAVLEELVPRITGAKVDPYVVRIGGPAAVRWAYSTALMLLEEKHCDHVILLLDADTTLRPQIERRQGEIEAMLDEHRLDRSEVSVCLAVPQIEAWLLSAYDDRPEEAQDPKAALRQNLGTQQWTPESGAQLAHTLDLGRACERSPSFDNFVRTLKRVVERGSQAPAA